MKRLLNKGGWSALTAALLMGSVPQDASAQWLTGEASMETRMFSSAPLQAVQDRHDASLVLAPEFYVRVAGGGIVFAPYARIDAADEERSHVDLRVLAWEGAFGDWEIAAGVSRVFWGVTESQHLVDILNQTDLVENLDGEDKLGQPMVKVGRVTDLGVFEAYALPGFRERTFPGREGRLRAGLPLDADRAQYTAEADARSVDFAARWSHFIGALDVGVSWFRGINREPGFLPLEGDAGGFAPIYDVANQVGLDAQWTRDAWLWKFEGITRDAGQQGRYWAMTAGVEYSLYQIMGSDADLGLITEVLLDDRGDMATTPFEDDIFVGGRLAMNDVAGSELLFGGIVDRSSGSTFLNLEGSRRLSNNWTIDLQMRAFLGVDPGERFHDLRNDDHLMVAFRRFF